jgi:aminopeptidase N
LENKIIVEFIFKHSCIDQIALPDFYFGAMENWGLVTYRETNLLYDPLTSSNGNKERTATIIAHELAHMVGYSPGNQTIIARS